MNYFGHAVIAHAYRPEPAFVLGAMLPDLLHLADGPLGELGDATLEQGVAFHQRTDAVFHASPTFVAWCHEALDLARRAGVSKGPARGMTHLVVELIIDAKLALVPVWQDVYMNALSSRPRAIAAHSRLAEGLDWLRARGPGLHSTSAERLRRALGATLGRRPRLAPSEVELDSALSAWAGLPALVEADLPALLGDLASLFTGVRETQTADFVRELGALLPPRKGD
jgi:hypothetical protein